MACVLTAHVLAEPANVNGCLAAGQFAQPLSRVQLKAFGAWENPGTGSRGPVPKSAIHRVIGPIDPAAIEEVRARCSRPRVPLARALAANRNAENHDGTVTLVDNASGATLALPGFNDDGGERAAMHDLPERSGIRGTVTTVDALHTVRAAAALIAHGCGTAGHPRHIHQVPETSPSHPPFATSQARWGKPANTGSRSSTRRRWRRFRVGGPGRDRAAGSPQDIRGSKSVQRRITGESTPDPERPT